MNKNGVKIYIEVIGEHLKKNEFGGRRKRVGEDVIAHNQRVLWGDLERSNALSRDGFGKGNRRCPFQGV